MGPLDNEVLDCPECEGEMRKYEDDTGLIWCCQNVDCGHCERE